MVLYRSKLALIALAFLLGATARSVPAHADLKPTTTVEASKVEVYPAGERFIVAIHQPDGGALLNLVEGPGLKRPDGVAPDVAEVIRRARIILTIRVSPDGQVTGRKVTNLRLVTPLQPQLSPAQPTRVNNKIAATVSELASIGQMLHTRSKTVSPPPSTAAAPASDTAK